MTDQDILDLFTRIIRDILSNESITLTMRTKREEVPNWDSMSYITFVAAVEIELGVKFKVADIESFEDVGAIVAQTKTMLR